jgi:hypothetical protein
MNLRSWIKFLNAMKVAGASHFVERNFGQNGLLHLDLHTKSFMPFPLLFARRAVVCFCWSFLLAIPAVVFGQTNYYTTNGTEYAIIGQLPGDQVFPDAAVTPSGGFVVWQDNITDGSGFGISARRLDSTLSGTLSTFRVNVQGTNDQENPRVTLLKNGGAAFIWQGGAKSKQHIFARLLTPTNTWLMSTDVVVSTFSNNFQINPAVTTLNNSNIVVVWGSFDQVGSNSLQDVYGQILSPIGNKIGTNFLINQFTSYNQRTPAIAALKNGGFVVTWVSEQERAVAPTYATPSANVTANAIQVPSIDVYARLYNSNGVAQGNEFLVNQDYNPCANPTVAAGSDGGFMIVWDAHDMSNLTNSLDVYARSFSSTGVGGTAVRVNSYLYGDQYAPRINLIGTDYLVAWTSLAQDGSREGVYGQFLHSGGASVGGEFRVNTTTISEQMQPVVASDGVDQFLVVWTSYTGSPYSFDLFAQRYANVSAILQPMAAPFVYAPFTLSNNVYQPQLQVSWPPLLGISVSNYEVYVDGLGTPTAVTTSNIWIMTAAYGLTTNATHSFQVDYVTTDDRRSPISPSASGTTWSGLNYYGIPYEWMAEYFGGYFSGAYHPNFWPSAKTSVASGGPSLYQVFLSGGNPLDPSTWLMTQLSNTSQGLFLSWKTQPGLTYQVQVTTNLTSWSNLGSPRFAAGNTDSIYVGGGTAAFYRVVLLYQ